MRLGAQIHIVNHHHTPRHVGTLGGRDVRSQSVPILRRQPYNLLQNQLRNQNKKKCKEPGEIQNLTLPSSSFEWFYRETNGAIGLPLTTCRVS
jgi:hypothetical protein